MFRAQRSRLIGQTHLHVYLSVPTYYNGVRRNVQEMLVQRLSRVPDCVFAGYSGVLSTFPFVELRGEEEARDRKVVRVAACNHRRTYTLAWRNQKLAGN